MTEEEAKKMKGEIEDIKEVLKEFIRHIRPDGELIPFSYNDICFLKDMRDKLI